MSTETKTNNPNTNVLQFFNNTKCYVFDISKEKFNNLHRAKCVLEECKLCKIEFQYHPIHTLKERLIKDSRININLVMSDAPVWQSEYNLQPVNITKDCAVNMSWEKLPDLSMYGAFMKSNIVNINNEKKYNVMQFSFHGIYAVVQHDLACKKHKAPSVVRLNTHMQLASRDAAFYCSVVPS